MQKPIAGDEKGQIGNSTPLTDEGIPVLINTTNLTTNTHFIKVFTGEHSCGITNDGKSYCWGYNGYGQLGIGGNTDTSVPTAIALASLNQGSTYKELAVGGAHTCGLTSDGRVNCWGLDAFGQLGNGGANTNQELPVSIDLTNLNPNFYVEMSSPTTGSKFYTNTSPVNLTIVGDTDATRWCVLEKAFTDPVPARPAYNDGCFVTPKPTTVTLGAQGVRKIYVYTRDVALNVSTSPATATIAYSTSGPANPSTWTMSSPNNGATSNDTTPRLSDTGLSDAINGTAYVYDAGACASAIGTGAIGGTGNFTVYNIAYASDGSQDGAKSFFGKIVDQYGNESACVNLSLGYTLATIVPTISIANASVSEGSGPGLSYAEFTITAGSPVGADLTVNYATSDGSATLADSDYANTSGTATINAGALTATFYVPITRDSVIEVDETFNVALSGGSNYTAAGSTLTAVGTIVNDEKKNFISLSLGVNTGCGIASDGNAYCWGNDGSGQVGNGATTGSQARPSLVDISNLSAGTRLTQISTKGSHTCGVASDGKAYCWGDGINQAIGDGASTTNQDKPVLVDTSNLAAGSGFKTVTVGNSHTCGLTSDGKAYCWGLNTSGQVGDGGVAGASVDKPYLVDTSRLTPGTSFIQITAGENHTCGVANDGKTYCWGNDSNGQLGYDDASQNKPGLVDTTNLSAGSHFTYLSAGQVHTCGITSDGKAYCWGLNSSSQLGTWRC